jgi:hypothetical protein
VEFLAVLKQKFRQRVQTLKIGDVFDLIDFVDCQREGIYQAWSSELKEQAVTYNEGLRGMADLEKLRLKLLPYYERTVEGGRTVEMRWAALLGRRFGALPNKPENWQTLCFPSERKRDTIEYWEKVRECTIRLFPGEETAFIGLVMTTYERKLDENSANHAIGLLAYLTSGPEAGEIKMWYQGTAREISRLFAQPGADPKRVVATFANSMKWV